jgi:murein DD-endopeptidase MepM/ murein hydrolase activator NlpD
MTLTSPLKKIKGKQIITTLGYGDRSFAETYKRLGWSIRAHNGEDYACVGAINTYGLPAIACQPATVQSVQYDTPMSTKGNNVMLEGVPFEEDGVKKVLCTIYSHLAEVYVKPGDVVKRGQEIGTVGNSGYVVGSASNPFSGAHLHFGVYEYHWENGAWVRKGDNPETNGAVSPSKWLERDWKTNAPEIDKIQPEKQFHPIAWGLNKIQEAVDEIAKKVKELLTK